MDIMDIECGCDTTLTANMKKWMEEMQNSVNNPNLSTEEQSWKDVSIYRVPAFVRDLSHEIFTPELVSLGPYHHNNEELKKMEVHKERALVHFVRKAGKTLGDIVAAVDKVMKELQDSYYRLEKTWKSDKDGPSRFLELMITDGCFMLEILEYAVNRGESYSPTDPGAYSPTDPFFSEHGVNHTMPYIRRDMLLIENQLPLLLLKTLVSVGRTSIQGLSMQDIDDYIHNLVLKFLQGGDEQVKKMGLRVHALDLLRHSLLTSNNTTMQSGKEGASGVIRSAVELREAGVRFRASKTKSFRDIHFDPSTGILYLPELVVHDATECMLRNMVVFEHLHANIYNSITSDHGITSYVCFMDELIDSAADVSLLHSRGIIQSSLGSDKQVAGLFNNRITKEVTVDPKSSLNEVREEVQKYCQRKWNKWRANLLHTYFRNPWSMLSLAGALLVILLTILQTVFSGMQIYQG